MKLIVMLLCVVTLSLSATTTYQLVEARQSRAEVRELAVAATKPLCAFEKNIKRRVQYATDRLEQPNSGVNISDLQEAIARDEETLEAIRFVECPPDISVKE